MVNNSDNDAILFRASADGGQIFDDKINLSNTADSNSTRVKIDSLANNVVVTWWETNQSSDTPVFSVSNDNAKTLKNKDPIIFNDKYEFNLLRNVK